MKIQVTEEELNEFAEMYGDRSSYYMKYPEIFLYYWRLYQYMKQMKE